MSPVKESKCVLVVKISASALALALAVARVFEPRATGQWLDSTFLFLLLVPVLAFFVPWHRLRTLKAAGVELVLDAPSVRGAITGIEMSRVESRRIRIALRELSEAIRDSVGGRVLWIDDNPHEVLGERRILRSLGVEVVPAGSSDAARAILRDDNDFDLIVSDVQRRSDPESKFTRYGGMEFAKEIREMSVDQNAVVQSLPVLFYTAYRPDQIQQIVEQVGTRSLTDIHICYSIEGLLRRVFELLACARAEVISVKSEKPATDIR